MRPSPPLPPLPLPLLLVALLFLPSLPQPIVQSFPNTLSLPNPPRIGITSIKPLQTSAVEWQMSLPLAPRKGKLEYPGKSVLDALWSTGSWSVRETSIAELILSSFCSSESLGGASGVMVDGGSHIGFFSHLALASGCSVVAVEPFAPSREFLEHTAVLNGNRDRLTVVPALVSDADSQEGHPFDGWQVAAESESTTSVPSIRLDSVLSTLYPDPSQHRVVYVKLDVEGHEASALAGLSAAVESPAPPLSVYLELTTFDRSVPGSHQEQAEAAARLLERLEAGGKYFLLPLEGAWSDRGLQFLPSQSGNLAQLIVASQKVGCTDAMIGVCITEVLAVHESVAGGFEQIAQARLDGEMAAIRNSVGGRLAPSIAADGTTYEVAAGEPPQEEDPTVPHHTMFVKDTKKPESERQTIRIEYPADVWQMDSFFMKESGACDAAGFTKDECRSVVDQAKQYVREHAARQLGISDLVDKVSY